MTSKPPIRERTLPPNFLSRPGTAEPHAVRALKQFSAQQLGDPFSGIYGTPANGGRTIIEPTFNMVTLLRLPLENAVLGPCIDAMVTNVVGHGYTLAYIGARGEETSTAAQAEKTALLNLLDAPGELRLQDMIERVQRDREIVGAGYMEVGRNGRGEVVMLSHVPAHTLRQTTRDADPVEVKTQVRRGGKPVVLKERKCFRRYVQMVNECRIFFKEFGDPRRIDPETGEENPSLAHEESATEILAVAGYSPGHVYPVPRWMGQLASVLGGRQAELTNLDYFKENAIPAMALLVSGGTVTQETIDELESTFTAARGRASQNRIVIIEVAGADDPAAPSSVQPPKVELKPLHGERQADALFGEYEASNDQKVRSAFRLPPLFTGRAQEHRLHNAQTSFEVAESQVFGPERTKVEAALAKVIATLGGQFWKLTLNPPRITSPDALVKVMEVVDKLGGMTPNAAVEILNKNFGTDIKRITAPWGAAPMQFSMAMLKAKRLKGVEAITKPSR